MASLLAPAAPSRPVSSFSHRDFEAEGLSALKIRTGRRVRVVIPARDEEETIAAIVSSLAEALVHSTPLVDELVVVDDASRDETGRRAAAAGARVVAGPGRGKGEAMAAGVAALGGNLEDSIVVFLDGDVTDFTPAFVTGLAGPLLSDENLELAKARYRRPIGDSPHGGGRVTELVAKPALGLLFPELSSFAQPLAGETAVRGSLLGSLELAPGYAVEVAMLIDAARLVGADRLCEVDLGVRTHRNRPLEELVPQAREVLAAVLARAL